MRAKLTNTQLNTLKYEAKNQIGTILRLNKKNFEDEEFKPISKNQTNN